MRFYWLTIGLLSVWRVTHLFAAEDGPWQVLVRLRRRAGGGFFGQLLDCFYCLSLWIAAPVAWLIGEGWKGRALTWLALSGGAILLERATTRGDSILPAPYHEDPEEQEAGAGGRRQDQPPSHTQSETKGDYDGMLRKE